MTMSRDDIRLIVEGRHTNPHSVLGLHVEENGICVRAFCPDADSITVVLRSKKAEFPMEKIHDAGLFEANIPKIHELSEAKDYKLKFRSSGGNEWIAYDPYSFGSQISKDDLYLFGQGTHYQIYKKLGANVMTVDGVPGVLFAVWAPEALRVSVVGDFNGWDGRRHTMRKLSDQGVWEIFVPGLCEGDTYCYEIIGKDEQVRIKSDPYGKYAQMRPETSSRVFDITGFEWHDKDWMDSRSQLESVKSPVNIYEVHLGSWMRKEDGTFLSYYELADKLVDYVKKMHFSHVELLPVQEHPLDESWGYQVCGYYAVTSRFGDPKGFMHMMDRFHEEGIGVILDWVPAHFPKDAHGLARFDGSALYEHADPRMGEHPEWGTLIYNYGRNEVRNFLLANALYWIKEFHADGLRVDAVASMLHLDYAKNDGEWIPNKYGGNENLEAVEFLKQMNSVVKEKYPGVMIIAEESSTWPGVTADAEEGGLGFTFKWNMGWMHDFLDYMSEETVHRKYHHNLLTFGMTYAYSENYVLVLSHDEVVHTKSAMIGKMPGDEWQRFANLRAAYGFMYGHPGKKLLFMGDELGQYSEWNEGTELEWGLLQYDIHKGLTDFVRDLNRIYRENNAFWFMDQEGFGFEWINADDAQRSIYSFIRRGREKEDTLIVICNFTETAYEDFRIGVPFAGTYEEILNSDAEKYGGSGVINTKPRVSKEVGCDNRENSIQMRLAPLSVTILKVV